MTELNISHFNGLELTYIDLIGYFITSVYNRVDSQKHADLPEYDVHQHSFL